MTGQVRRHDVAIVGLGLMGQRHAEVVAAYPRARLAAVVEVDPERGRAAGERFGCPAFTDLASALEGVHLDAALICTPDALHVAPTVEALEAGLHVLLEKPIATTLDDADTIIAAAARRPELVLTVGHCLRFDPKYVALQRRVGAGAIGDVVGVATRRQNRVSAQVRLRGRISSQQFLGVHDYDVINWIVGARPTEVVAMSTDRVMRSLGHPIDDMTFTNIRYDSGAIAMAETGWMLAEGSPLPYRFELDAFGSAGNAHLEVFDEGLSIAHDRYELLSTLDRLTPQIAHFLDCIEAAAPPLVSGLDARVALQIALASEASAASGRPIPLPPT
ncbi:MAG: Gfo/Idh/MocA family oxidoreductase [bacterium]|nr:Gfo/Idh/MocA family oxidoreductase [bacterium]